MGEIDAVTPAANINNITNSGSKPSPQKKAWVRPKNIAKCFDPTMVHYAASDWPVGEQSRNYNNRVFSEDLERPELAEVGI